MRQTNVCSNGVFVPGFTQAHEGLKWRRRRRSRRRRRKQPALKNNFSERKHFIRRYQRNGWRDFIELQAIDSLLNEGTNTLVRNGRFRLKRIVCRAWAHERAPLNLHWLVLTNGGTNFYNCWLVDSI